MKIEIGRHHVEITHADKVFFPRLGLSKADLARYYRRIARWMLHHIHDRAVTLERYPDGIVEKGFFQQQAAPYFDKSIERTRLPHKSGGALDHVVCRNGQALVYLVNFGVVTLHMWLSRLDTPEHPDRMIFDLDPSDNDFASVRFGAARLREILEQLGLLPFIMTTGSRGAHIVVPLDRKADFTTVRDFAAKVAKILVCRYPERLTVEQRKDKRKGRLYVDVQRNAYGQTGVAPYSLRAVEKAGVATPLDWDEFFRLQGGPETYTVKNIFNRLGQKGDPWRQIRRHARSLNTPQHRLAGMQEG